MIVIEICGYKGAGKSYLSGMLTKEFSNLGLDILKTSFAVPLKKLLRNLYVNKYGTNHKFKNFDEFMVLLSKKLSTLINDKKLLTEKILENVDKLKIGYEEYFNNKNFEKGFRILAQTIETNLLRSINENIWVNITVDKILNAKNIDIVILDDYRFLNENLSYLEKLNKNIKAVRIRINYINLKKDELSLHESEKYIDKLPVDYEIIRNDKSYNITLNSLVNKILNNNL